MIDGMTTQQEIERDKSKAKEAKHLKETIVNMAVMMHSTQGGKVEVSIKGLHDSGWTYAPYPCWNFRDFVFRAKP